MPPKRREGQGGFVLHLSGRQVANNRVLGLELGDPLVESVDFVLSEAIQRSVSNVLGVGRHDGQGTTN